MYFNTKVNKGGVAKRSWNGISQGSKVDTICGMQGDKMKKCFSNPKNADKVPKWYLKNKARRSKSETELASSNTEMVLMAFEHKKMSLMELLADLGIWVVNTGASVDSIQYFIVARKRSIPVTMKVSHGRMRLG